MLIFVKLTEEPRLLKDFGTDYEDYRRRVSMLVPWNQCGIDLECPCAASYNALQGSSQLTSPWTAIQWTKP